MTVTHILLLQNICYMSSCEQSHKHHCHCHTTLSSHNIVTQHCHTTLSHNIVTQHCHCHTTLSLSHNIVTQHCHTTLSRNIVTTRRSELYTHPSGRCSRHPGTQHTP